MNNARPSVCFVAPLAYPLLSGKNDLGIIGGAETQQVILAHELITRGYPVRFIVWDHGQPDAIVHNDIRVFKMCRQDKGVPFVRFLHPRASSLWRAMTRAGSDIYIQRTADSDTGFVARWCRRNRCAFVFSVASETDCLANLPDLPTRRERLLYRYGLRRTCAVVTQTRHQHNLLREHFGIDSVRIPNCGLSDRDSIRRYATAINDSPHRVIWVGRFAAVKRLELLLDVAERCPGVCFDVLGSAEVENAYSAALLQRAESLQNVFLHGFVPYARIGEYYDRAALLICTSKWEGFPNTFLEAWSRGIPVISTVDPDRIVSENDLGLVEVNAVGLTNAIRHLLTDRPRWQNYSRRVMEYFNAHHTVGAAVDAYEDLFRRLTTGI